MMGRGGGTGVRELTRDVVTIPLKCILVFRDRAGRPQEDPPGGALLMRLL